VVEGVQGLRELAVFGAGSEFLQRLMRKTRLVHAIQMRYGMRAGLEQAAIDVLLALAVLATVTTGLVLILKGALGFALYPMAIVLAAAGAGADHGSDPDRAQAGRAPGGGRPRRHDFPPGGSGRGPRRRLTRDCDGAARPLRGGEVWLWPRRKPVLDGFDLELRPGETVALVGASGAGKTTCANLLMRFWDPQQGRISIFGRDIRDLPLDALRRKVTLVPQDVHLFSGTVADNIQLGRPEARDAEIERAARLVQAHEFILALSHGYATQCGERGTRLSGGQRQRIAIARAFLRDAPILVMDEAVSNLDSDSEAALHVAMETVRRGRTVLIIAHRPSTIRRADRIVVLEGGGVVEDGTHETRSPRTALTGGCFSRESAVRRNWHERPTGRASEQAHCGDLGLRARRPAKRTSGCPEPSSKRSPSSRSKRHAARRTGAAAGAAHARPPEAAFRHHPRRQLARRRPRRDAQRGGGAHKQAAANLEAADAVKRASSSGSDLINKILTGNPQVQAFDPFALLENRQTRQITGQRPRRAALYGPGLPSTRFGPPHQIRTRRPVAKRRLHLDRRGRP
jgi:ABC-type multidrug transport system ATPase subunit